MRTRSILPILYLAAFFGCGGDTEPTETGEVEAVSYSLTILSPEADASYALGEVISLAVEVVDNSGTSVGIDQVSWQTGDWLANGNNLSVSDLPEGSRALVVTVVAQGETFTESVDIHIGTEDDDDGGGGSGSAYSGVVEADITLKLDSSSGGTTYQDPCEGWIDFNIDDSEIRGEGSCRAFGEDWVFAIQGTDKDGVLSGSLSMEFEEEGIKTDPTPFSGTRDDLDHVEIQFEGTHYPGEVNGVGIEYLDLLGSIIADPTLD